MFLIKVILGVIVGLALIMLVLWILTKLNKKNQPDINEENIRNWFRKRR
jgi:NhaP-type Na+/H+ or K+/H+ antiporter